MICVLCMDMVWYGMVWYGGMSSSHNILILMIGWTGDVTIFDRHGIEDEIMQYNAHTYPVRYSTLAACTKRRKLKLEMNSEWAMAWLYVSADSAELCIVVIKFTNS